VIRTILGKVSRQGNRYLRVLFVQAAWVVLIKPQIWERYGLKQWITAAKRRLHPNVVAIALANKPARIAWAVLPRQHHALLVDEHGGVFGAFLLGPQRRGDEGFFDAKGAVISVAVSAFPNEIYKPRAVGLRKRIRSSFITTSLPKAGTLRRGSSRNSIQRKFARG
jgi:hypothetical protein